MRKIGEILRGGAFERYLSSQEAAVDYVDERVDGRGRIQYLDSMGSVSALIEVEEDYDYDATHIQFNRRLIHNGS